MLLGPFLDSEHPEIKKGIVDRTFTEIFHVEILRRLQDYAEFMGSAARVILVPSIRDANHDFVFPQPAFDIHPSNLKDQKVFPWICHFAPEAMHISSIPDILILPSDLAPFVKVTMIGMPVSGLSQTKHLRSWYLHQSLINGKDYLSEWLHMLSIISWCTGAHFSSNSLSGLERDLIYINWHILLSL
ncbi:hypothetical protein NE237_020880 [Protea cynaroides]|uniref:DNA polymerase alpha subunit B n=1 Tax=Protea cynaroides TaxID=273540 RepID=A0A9Q0HA78_9MAGN|nr:hypothetical protein NE237_020880 [Protea cynaroides]